MVILSEAKDLGSLGDHARNEPRSFASLRMTAAALTTILAGCGGTSATAPAAQPTNTPVSFPGFDISIYPGDAAMRAWLRPASPYYWSGYYLFAPCHRDGSWTGKYATLAAMGWGIAALYVGQQDWTQIPTASANRAAGPESFASGASGQFVTCSASLLTADQGVSEAADAVSKMRADGFPDQTIVFLDVEHVTTVTPALLDYYRAWIGGVLADGHYQPGVYAAKSNASILYAAAADVYKTAARSGAPAFWIASSTNFSIGAAPAAVGFDFAKLWQGMFDVAQSYGGLTLTIDVDVASSKSPSTP